MAEQKIKQTTIVEQVMSRIKELIASGEYKPGDKIPTELELSEIFGVGRSSIREAVKIFNYLGVLKSQTAKGTYVQERSKISKEALTWSLLLGNDDIEEMIDLRGAIEMWAMIKLYNEVKAGKPEAVDTINSLENIVKLMSEAADKQDKKKLVEYDFMFHHKILAGCGNNLFLSLFETLRSFLYKEIENSQMKYKNLNKIPEEHGVILKALKQAEHGVPDLVYSVYHDHISNIKEKLKEENN